MSRHIANIFKEHELDSTTNTQDYLVEYSDRPVTLYSLDVILSVGYRIRSTRGTQFRIWANNVLKEYLIKGYSLNETRLKETGRTIIFTERNNPAHEQHCGKQSTFR
ncbi:RhuM family protein [Chitinophaga lutea]|uniref:RhuM family protein n=1 Tax=Chitinophaga lutea TaxID=2488634 RepID=UPI0037442565